VAITWVQSYIRRADQRELLMQLDQARELLADTPNHAIHDQIDLCHANLFRMWAET